MESARRTGSTNDTTGGGFSAAPGECVLLCASPMDLTDADYCVTGDNTASVAASNVLAVTLDGTPDSVADRFRGATGRLPDRLAVVTVGDSTRGAAAASGGSGSISLPGGDISTASVSSPGDLTGLGIKLSQCLSAWDDDDNEIAVRFDSLTTLLQFAELKRVFRFVHVLTGRIDSAGAVGYFHLDPSAHDEQTLATLRGLFDTVVELGPDGEWTEA